MIHVIFDGVDGAGKTALKQGFVWRSGHKFMVSDRWVPSQMAYDPFPTKEWKDVATKVAEAFTESYLFIIEADPGVIASRIMARAPGARANGRVIEDWDRNDIETKVLRDMARFRRVAINLSPPYLPFIVKNEGPYDETVDEIVRVVTSTDLRVTEASFSHIIPLTPQTLDLPAIQQ